MKKFLTLLTFILAFSFAALAQEKMDMEGKTPTEKDKTEAIPSNGVQTVKNILRFYESARPDTSDLHFVCKLPSICKFRKLPVTCIGFYATTLRHRCI